MTTFIDALLDAFEDALAPGVTGRLSERSPLEQYVPVQPREQRFMSALRQAPRPAGSSGGVSYLIGWDTEGESRPPRSQYVHWRMLNKDGEDSVRGGVTFKLEWMKKSEKWKVSIAACSPSDTWCRKKGAAIATLKMLDGEFFYMDSPFKDARTDILMHVDEMITSPEIPAGVRNIIRAVWRSRNQ